MNRVNETIIHNTYNTTVIENNTTRVSYNGGNGGVAARATAQEETFSREQHVGRVPAQEQHIQQARANPELRASTNQGKPPIAATAKPADFKSGVVPARQAGGAYKAPPPNTARNGGARPATEARPENRPPATSEARSENRPPANSEARSENRPPATSEARSENRPAAPKPKPNNHAGELQPHTYSTPNAGNAATDKKYQQQQQQLASKQNQEHQKLQQQQEKEHQQAAKKNANDTQKQQMEQRHTQQTQQLEQKHATQQQKVEPHQPAPKESKPGEKHPEKPN